MGPMEEEEAVEEEAGSTATGGEERGAARGGRRQQRARPLLLLLLLSSPRAPSSPTTAAGSTSSSTWQRRPTGPPPEPELEEFERRVRLDLDLDLSSSSAAFLSVPLLRREGLDRGPAAHRRHREGDRVPLRRQEQAGGGGERDRRLGPRSSVGRGRGRQEEAGERQERELLVVFLPFCPLASSFAPVPGGHDDQRALLAAVQDGGVFGR